MPSWNLRKMCEDRILREVIGPAKTLAGRDSWLVLVVDPKTLRIVSGCMKMFDLMEQSVSVVENVMMRRQPLRGLDAVYFLTPTEESIRAFLKDCGDAKTAPLYRHAHLYFTGAVPKELFELIKASTQARAYIKTLVELSLDFLVRESRVFCVDGPAAMFHLYSPNTPDLEDYCRTLGNKLATMCVSLRTMPLVRYEAAGNSTAGRNIPQLIGTYMLASLRALAKAGVLKPTGPPVTLLIVGRTLDPVAPILCEFTYQAMAEHLLPIRRDHYTYTYSGQKKQVVLDDCDDMWPKLRHQHIADCIMQLLSDFNQFMKANKAGQAALEGTKAVGSLKDMAAIVRAMPQYFELLNKYITHMTIAGDCMAQYNKRRLAEMAAIEQDLATGFDAQGNEPKNVMNRLPPFLEDPNVSVEDKVRLLMLFIISQDGMKDSDRQRMMKYARLSPEDQAIIGNLGYLGVTLTKKVVRDKKKQKHKKNPAPMSDEVPYELSRFVPRIKGVLQSLVSGDLSETDYPFLSGDKDGAGAAGGDDKKKKKSLKATAKWADRSKTGAGTAAAAGQGDDYVGASDADQRFIVFVAGGMTYSESRSVYEVAAATSKNCYIGSTQFFTPTTFVQELSLLDKTPDQVEKAEAAFAEQQEPPLGKSKGSEGSAAPASSTTSTTTTTTTTTTSA